MPVYLNTPETLGNAWKFKEFLKCVLKIEDEKDISPSGFSHAVGISIIPGTP